MKKQAAIRWLALEGDGNVDTKVAVMMATPGIHAHVLNPFTQRAIM
jgi:hypothetical protein